MTQEDAIARLAEALHIPPKEAEQKLLNAEEQLYQDHDEEGSFATEDVYQLALDFYSGVRQQENPS